MTKNTVTVRAEWDGEAKVWVAESDDVPGLVAEAGQRDELVAKLTALIPELLDLNETSIDRTKPLEIVLQFRGEERIVLPVAA
jgi:predicted RNase H-like HicB family nuclease